MKSSLAKFTMLMALIITQTCQAGSSPLFYVQNLVQNLIIKSSMPHAYPAAGIKINTPGAVITGCTPSANGYCLFSVDNITPKVISITGVIYRPVNITLCLNGRGPLSCQNYDIFVSGLDFSKFFAGTSCGLFNFLDISATGSFIGRGDEASFPVPLATGHPINLYGTFYSTLFMSTNGVLTSTLFSAYMNTALPTAAVINALFVLWDDLNSPNPPLGLYYQYFPTCPRASIDIPAEGCHVFQWITKFYGTPPSPTFSFEAIVYDKSGEVAYQYGPGNTQEGSSSTTGAQNSSHTSFVQLSYNTFGSVPPNSIRCLKHYDDSN